MLPDSTIIVIDDDNAVVAALEALLGSFGMEVLAFPSAESFLAVRTQHPGRCLLLDVRLPGMSGLELQEALIAQADSRPIIFISGHADTEDRDRALAGGAVHFFTKPCDGRKLHDCIRQVLLHAQQKLA